MKTITSLTSPIVKYWTQIMRDARFRNSERKVLLEGKNVIGDVCKTIKASRLIVKDPSIIPDNVMSDEVILVTDAIIQKISGTKNPEGIIAELDMPCEQELVDVKKIIVADRIQDPGNLGTLIRSSLAFGWDGLFVLPGTCDPFNDKALRAAKGATFHLPIRTGSWEDLQALLKKSHLQLVVADLSGEAPSSFINTPIALVLGNEASGVSIPDGISYRSVTLPMKGAMESLNVGVAGSILLYLYQEGP